MTSALDRLADRAGILAGYYDHEGTWHDTPDETRVALLAVMGFDASDGAAADASLAAWDAREIAAMVQPARVARAGDARARRIPLRLAPHELAGALWRATIRADDGDPYFDGRAGGGTVDRVTADGRAEIELAELPAPGYYTLQVELTTADGARTGTQRLIVSPARCWTREAEGRAWGIVANLYTVRGGDGWGIGDLSDLRDVVEFAAEAGADFVGVNPLHALWNRGHDVSPYSPVSRLFRNPVYLDVTAVPELTESEEVRAVLADCDVARTVDRLRASGRVAYEETAALQARVLELLHAAFVAHHRDTSSPRGRAYADYRAAMGSALDDHATFVALDERRRDRGGAAWFREWPVDIATADGPGVPAARAELAERVDFHRWVQFELDRQLAEVAAVARRSGMRIGLYQDLAIGSSGGGSDAWAFDRSLARGVSIGAPPDALAEQGQDWGLPPLNPHRLREQGFRYWTLLLRSAFRHAGALRIDHVLGLVRQYWIPHGFEGTQGGYVAFPADDLFGILALESMRHEAVVVGEDLGTVPPELPGLLERWGVLSSQVLYFERDADGGFRGRDAYRHPVLATVNTHDLIPLAGWWRGRDLELRHELGLVPDDAIADQQAERARDRRRLVDRLVADGALTGDEGARLHAAEPTAAASSGAADSDAVLPTDVALLVRGTHRLLRTSPAALVGLSLDDLAGETEPVNVPGVANDEYESWTRRMRLPLARILADPRVREALG